MFPFKMAAAPMGTLPSVSGGTDFFAGALIKLICGLHRDNGNDRC